MCLCKHQLCVYVGAVSPLGFCTTAWAAGARTWPGPAIKQTVQRFKPYSKTGRQKVRLHYPAGWKHNKFCEAQNDSLNTCSNVWGCCSSMKNCCLFILIKAIVPPNDAKMFVSAVLSKKYSFHASKGHYVKIISEERHNHRL